MTHVSLFTGIGGMDLAAEWAGFETVLQVERDPYCLRVLEKHWPLVPRITDVKEVHDDVRWTHPTVVSGGFPCQPFSQAGKRAGTSDDRHLWPQMLRVIQELSPSYVVGENVFGLLSIDGGLVFETVCTDLERAGYDVLPLHYPAAGVGAPHRRDRVFIVAHRESIGRRERRPGRPDTSGAGEREQAFQDVPHAGRELLEGRQQKGAAYRPEVRGHSEWGAAQSGLGRDPARLSPWLDGDWERGIPRVATGVPNRVDRLRALGNAVVPQQCVAIFQTIAEVEHERKG